MPFSPYDPPYDQLMAAAERAADTRPEVDRKLAQEVFAEAASLLHNGLVLDALDDHDTRTTIGWLSEDLVGGDPGEAIRARAQAATTAEDLHDRDAVSDALLVTAALFGL
jgi:hypothetical protein